MRVIDTSHQDRGGSRSYARDGSQTDNAWVDLADRFELLDDDSHVLSHPSQLESIILVGLAFDVGPFPGIFVGRTDERLETVAHGQIVDPARRTAGFHDDEVDFVLFEDRLQVIPLGGRVKE